jgi:hypothetical protein
MEAALRNALGQQGKDAYSRPWDEHTVELVFKRG